ncbi:hypothetical protein HJ588_04040 [Flexivirga sp. ID2601S]|uniref:HTH cro/C1-type domain-containing protein n=1 Tax=Flexivirga aerilata TaxID=1656889 RepID=A0A849AD56_9MICO|nr:hypothetical protein [Flexivirga aerilata]NNG38445.1 hypothetical protein [Flexivirga aerilata]
MAAIDDLTPNLALRASLAAERLDLTPGATRSRLQEVGLPVARSFIYAIFDGSARNPNYRVVIGLAAVLGVRPAWFLDAFEDGVTDEEMLPLYVLGSKDDASAVSPDGDEAP